MKHLTLLILSLMMALTASATDIFAENCPEKYQPEQTAIISNPQSECNQGEEPFIEFMKRWNSDADFRTSRLKATWASPMADDLSSEEVLDMLKLYAGFLTDCGAIPMEAKTARRQFKTFYAVGANRVGFYVGGPDSSVRLGFMRTDGIWHCVYIMMAG